MTGTIDMVDKKRSVAAHRKKPLNPAAASASAWPRQSLRITVESAVINPANIKALASARKSHNS
ncbi:hypothetical protein ABW99_08215 [Pandoraea thiooxydans]|uniref:Uncharacterized protein n=1 Tax=Pandoraea thiooxydans TaxID=445709 RepID=A0A0G3EMI9_9BURK|nr:hypothetical protein ABW99_08215 [Pandoraea thiooxydans]